VADAKILQFLGLQSGCNPGHSGILAGSNSRHCRILAVGYLWPHIRVEDRPSAESEPDSPSYKTCPLVGSSPVVLSHLRAIWSKTLGAKVKRKLCDVASPEYWPGLTKGRIGPCSTLATCPESSVRGWVESCRLSKNDPYFARRSSLRATIVNGWTQITQIKVYVNLR